MQEERVKPKYNYIRLLVSRDLLENGDPDQIARYAAQALRQKRVNDEEVKKFVVAWYKAKERDIIPLVREWIYLCASDSPSVQDGGYLIR